MTNNKKCIAQLDECGIYCEEQNDRVYVYVQDSLLELSQFEVDFRAQVYDDDLAAESEGD